MAATPVYQAADLQSNTSANGTLVINKPSNLVTGDLMIAHVGASNISGPSWTPPSGWTAIVTGLGNSSSNPLVGCFWKVATGSEPSTYTFVESGNQRSVGFISRVTGADPTTPIDSSSAQANNTSSTNIAFSSITPTLNNNLIMLLVGAQNDAMSASSCTNVSSFTQQYSGSAPSTGGELSMATGVSSASGTVTPSGTQPGNEQSNSIALSIASQNAVTVDFQTMTLTPFAIARIDRSVVASFIVMTMTVFVPTVLNPVAKWLNTTKSTISSWINNTKS